MINTHTLIKEMIAHGVTEKHAEIMVNKFVSQKQFKQLEENVVKPSEFTIAVNKLENSIALVKSEISSLKWMIPLYFGLVVLILKYFK